MAETLDVTSMIPAKFEPKKKNRWILMVEGIDAYLIKTTARPSITTEAQELPFINSRRYIAGKTEFGTMAVTLYDAIAPSGAQQVMEWVRTHYESVSGRAGYADFYKRDIQLKLLDPVGTVVELWDIKGAFITSATFGDLDYGGTETVDITLELRYDNAVLQYLHTYSTTRCPKKEGLFGGLLHFLCQIASSYGIVSFMTNMNKCTRCDAQYESLISLSLHFRKTHKETAERLYVELFCAGKPPTCECGCGSSLKFLGIESGFTKFKRGHVSRIRNNWGHNEAVQEKSQAVRREMHKRGEITVWNKGGKIESDQRISNNVSRMREAILSDKEERQRRSNYMKSQWETGSIVPLTGSLHSQWQGGTSALSSYCRSRVFSVWTYPKMKAAGFKCTKCGASGKIDVHHDKERFAAILRRGIETLGEPGDDFDRKTCFADWVAWYHENHDVSGVVLCRDCHLEAHKDDKRHSEE